jgi:hypothetical protein
MGYLTQKRMGLRGMREKNEGEEKKKNGSARDERKKREGSEKKRGKLPKKISAK